jgi:hypothetical protein
VFSQLLFSCAFPISEEIVNIKKDENYRGILLVERRKHAEDDDIEN